MKAIDMFANVARQVMEDGHVQKYGGILLTRGFGGLSRLNPTVVWVDAAVAVIEAAGSYFRYCAAREVTEQLREYNRVLETTLAAKNAIDAPAAVGAALHQALAAEGRLATTILWPYVDKLQVFGGWWRQLWAESLGKDGMGSTPVSVLGPVDQHSQLQLFRDGPGNALFTLVSVDTKGKAEAPLTFPNGCHIAEVEIDPDTGHVDIVTYTAVDDCGNVLDQAVVEGQVQGSIANGLGQALTENAVYDSASGQLVTGSFMDYGMPRAHDMPLELREATHAVPATTNPLGVKGTGEAGTTAAIAAVMNAISNAVPNGAADHMDMPATPAKVWAAVQKGMGK